MKNRLGALLTGLYAGFTGLAGVVLILVSTALRRFFISRGAADVGDAVQLTFVAMTFVLWSSTAYAIWRRHEATVK